MKYKHFSIKHGQWQTVVRRRHFTSNLFAAVLFSLPMLCACTFAGDWRDFANGFEIPDENYCDQPYVVRTQDGNWLCTLTTGEGHEGHGGQHVVATISEDKGRTWSPLIDIEPSGEIEASWVIPLVTDFGRVYAFYDYNGDNVGHGNPEFAKNGDPNYRADMLGWYCYRYSDNHGQTWSKKRYRLPMPVAACDLKNQWQGRIQIFWGIDKPKIADGSAFFAFSRLGKYLAEEGEGWLYRSDNILTEPDADKIVWKLLPESGHGIRNEEFGSVQEEHNTVPLGNDQLYCVYRTTLGHPCHSYSADGGRSWTPPVPMTYTPGGKIIRHPRACPKLWKTSNGRYLLWFHNNGNHSYNRGERYGARNVSWLSAGELIDGRMHWSQPEIVRYCSHPLRGCSYPDLFEDQGHFYLTATQKTEARIGEVPQEFLEALWSQGQLKQVTKAGLVLEATSNELKEAKSNQLKRPMPALPDLSKGGGLTMEMWVRLPSLNRTRTLISSSGEDGSGFFVRSTVTGQIRLDICDGISGANWECDPGILKPKKLHHVAFVVDGGPKIISVIVDGVLCDGGTSESRLYGWGRFGMDRCLAEWSDEKLTAHEIQTVSGGDILQIDKRYIKAARLYDRTLLTSEVIANFNAGMN